MFTIPLNKNSKKLPTLDDRFFKTPIEVTIYSNETGEYGENTILGTYKGFCYYQEKVERIFSNNGISTVSVAQAIFNVNICTTVDVISNGEVLIFNSKRKIKTGQKIRDFNGNVVSVILELE